jgi:hypothetical protein
VHPLSILTSAFSAICVARKWNDSEEATSQGDDRCANPRIYFGSFHAPHPSKNTKNEFIHKNIIKKYIFQKIYKNMNNLYFIIIYHIKL